MQRSTVHRGTSSHVHTRAHRVCSAGREGGGGGCDALRSVRISACKAFAHTSLAELRTHRPAGTTGRSPYTICAPTRTSRCSSRRTTRASTSTRCGRSRGSIKGAKRARSLSRALPRAGANKQTAEPPAPAPALPCPALRCTALRCAALHSTAPQPQPQPQPQPHERSMAVGRRQVLVSVSTDGRVTQWSIKKGLEFVDLMKYSRALPRATAAPTAAPPAYVACRHLPRTAALPSALAMQTEARQRPRE